MNIKKYALYTTHYYRNFMEFLQGIAEKYAQDPAVSVYEGERLKTYTYQQVCHDAFALGETFLLEGLGGKQIALAGENSYEWLIAFFAIVITGGVAVLVDIEQPDKAVLEMIQHADAQVVMPSQAIEKLLQKSELKELRVIPLRSRDEPDLGVWIKEGEHILAKGTGKLSAVQLLPDQTAIIAYTSGTTSVAKPVMLSHKGLLYNIGDATSFVKLQGKVFTSLPLYHTYGLTCGVLCGMQSGTHICVNGNIKTMMQEMKLFDPQILMAVPLITEIIGKKLKALAVEKKKTEWQQLAPAGRRKKQPVHKVYPELEKIKKEAFGSLSMIVCGGAYLAEGLSQIFYAFGVLVLQGYGITECSPLVSVNRNDSYQFDSVGYPLKSLKIKFLKDEILIQGPSVMQGYYKAPELTKEAFYKGWFQTGDLGYLDKDGFLHISGRKKNLIVLKNGKKISPEEIEAYLSDLPIVKEVLAYGASNGISADDVKVAVTVYPNPEMTKNLSSYEILASLQKEIDRVNRSLPTYKQIQMIHIRENEFLKTATKKIKRQPI